MHLIIFFFFFFFNDTATTEIYTLSLHDALPICLTANILAPSSRRWPRRRKRLRAKSESPTRSEEHTSELQSRRDVVCRLLLEKESATHTSSVHQVVSLASARMIFF